jgi:predicted GNAT superfamily acetyltransferase
VRHSRHSRESESGHPQWAVGKKADEILIRDVEGLAEMEQVEALEKEVWGVTERDVVPISLLIPAKEVGAILLGAFDGKQLVGFCFGFLGQEGGQTTIHSHTLGVKAAYRDHNLGYRLKLAQRESALRMGIHQMTWTFDPLQTRNAYLNFAKLGVVSDSYKIDFYGEHSESFLHQHGTDRLWVRWFLDSQRVRERLENRTGQQTSPQVPATPALLEVGDDGKPRTCADERPLQPDSSAVIEIPIYRGPREDDRGLGREWRMTTRRAFTEALRAGLIVSDFYRCNRGAKEVGAYLLSPRDIGRLAFSSLGK